MKGGWIQVEEPRTFKFPNSEKALADAIDAAGPALGPTLLSMSEFLITSLNESYQSRYVLILDTIAYGWVCRCTYFIAGISCLQCSNLNKKLLLLSIYDDIPIHM